MVQLIFEILLRFTIFGLFLAGLYNFFKLIYDNSNLKKHRYVKKSYKELKAEDLIKRDL